MKKTCDVDLIFSEAANIEEPGARDDFLHEASGGDAQRCGEVDKLLAAHDQAGSFMRGTDCHRRSTVQ